MQTRLKGYWWEQRELLIADTIWYTELSYGKAWVICEL